MQYLPRTKFTPIHVEIIIIFVRLHKILIDLYLQTNYYNNKGSDLVGMEKVLSELLKENNTNANEIAKVENVSPNTLYSIIRRDNMKVDVDVLIRVAESLGVTAEYFYARRTYPFKSCDYSLTKQEILKKYRALDERVKGNVLAILDQEYNHSQENNEGPSENKVG